MGVAWEPKAEKDLAGLPYEDAWTRFLSSISGLCVGSVQETEQNRCSSPWDTTDSIPLRL